MINNKIYPDNPLHLYSYELEDKILKVVIINKNDAYCESVDISCFSEKKTIKISTNEHIIHAEIEIANKYYLGEPVIEKAIIDHHEYIFDYKNFIYVKSEKPILRPKTRENAALISELSTLGLKKENIRFYPFKEKEYWRCACGKLVLGKECPDCNIKEDELFKERNDYEIKTSGRNLKLQDTTKFIWIAFLYFIHMYVINVLMKGDILYHNGDMQSFFSLANRFIFPSIIILCVGLDTFVPFKKRIVNYILLALETVSMIYMNVLLFISLANVSYNVFVTLGFDIVYVIEAVKYFVKKKKISIKMAPVPVFLITVIYSLGCIGYLSQYNLRVDKNTICVEVKNKENYASKNRINNLDVATYKFKSKTYYNNLKNITVSKNISTIEGFSSVYVCNLESISLDDKNKNYYMSDGVLYNAHTGNVAMFANTQKEVTIRNNKLNDYCFSSWTGLEKVIIGKEVETIGAYAFSDCTNLKEIIFEDESSLKDVGEYAFLNCSSLKKIAFPDSIEKFGIGYLSGCLDLEEITIPFIGDKRYEEYSYSNKNIYDYIFSYSLSYKTIDKLTVTRQCIVQDSSFYQANIKELVINDFNGYFGRNCFAYSKIEKIVIPEGVTELRENCFANCENLKEVVLPSTLSKIGQNAFKNTENIVSFDISKVNTETLTIESGNDSILKYFK